MKNLLVLKHKIQNSFFVIPFDNRNKAVEKRMSTAMSWAGVYDKDKFVEYQNEFMEGFEFVDCVERVTTSANHFEIRHPLGFTFEIQARTVIDIIRNLTIVNGVIQEKCKIGSTGIGKLTIEAESGSVINLSSVKDGLYEFINSYGSKCVYVPNAKIREKDGTVVVRNVVFQFHHLKNYWFFKIDTPKAYRNVTKADISVFDGHECFDYTDWKTFDKKVNLNMMDNIMDILVC